MIYEVIHDIGETANKCTVAPLCKRPDFQFISTTKSLRLGPLTSSVLLHHEGKCLSLLRAELGPISGIATIDCIWRRLDGLIARIDGTLPILAKIPSGIETAYPRRTFDSTDPTNGLATIEALFVASAILGRWDETLLSEYFFGRRFIEINTKRFLDLGITEANGPITLSHRPVRNRNAMQRRLDRGRKIPVIGLK